MVGPSSFQVRLNSGAASLALHPITLGLDTANALVQDYMGYRDIRTTMKYVQISESARNKR
ncbi:hypothetical protein SAMN05216167_12931 [Spirosoma endophyticum]|uniref:Phage integrase family protein n=1 Tax=Spirosoma endophyticum TaxID=662367 RepID=A0A1I2G444_9BACT|nr:hypothetical protein SAMN05216167_12931 [Spirosoma endophyticum]